LVGSGGDGGKFNDEEVVWYFHMGMGNIPKTPLCTYKRRLPSPHFNNTQEKSIRAREEQHHSWA
jgi:hypothetical protein